MGSRWMFIVGVLIAGFLAGVATGCEATPTITVEPPQTSGEEGISPLGTPSPLRGISPLSPPATPIPTIMVTEEPEVDRMTQEEAIALAKRTLAEWLGIDEASVEVVWAGHVTWSDTSLGCPEKGKMYAQVLTPGYQVLLRVDEKEYEVHTGGGRAVICPAAQGRVPPLDRTQAAGRAYERAREDLSRRLGVPVAEITPRLIQPTTWPDGSLGCPQPGETYPQAPTEGFIILLEYQGETYEYHADGERIVLCTPPSP